MDKRITAGILGGAALLMLIGILTHDWYTAEGYDGTETESVRLGLWGSVKETRCGGGECQTVTIPLKTEKDETKIGLVFGKIGLVFGKIGYIVGLIAVALLALVAVLVATQKENALVLNFAKRSTWMSAICAVMFLALIEVEPPGGVDISPCLYFIGAVAGTVVITLHTSSRNKADPG